MIEGFFGHVTEKNPGNIPTFLQFNKRVATEAFQFVILVVTSSSTTACVETLVSGEQEMSCPPLTRTLL